MANWVLGNHDKPRLATRIGEPQARVAAMLLLTLRGTPTLYYGDELAMCDSDIPRERLHDRREQNEPSLRVGCDPQRTPMQWDSSRHAGFTTGEPWLPVCRDAAHRNVDRLSQDGRSVLSLYRRLIHLRGQHDALSVGQMKFLPARAEAVLMYERMQDDERFLIALNLTDAPQSLCIGTARARVVLSTLLDREERVQTALELRENEGVILRSDDPARAA